MGSVLFDGHLAPCTLTNVIAWPGKDRVTSHVWLQATFVAHLGKMVLQMAGAGAGGEGGLRSASTREKGSAEGSRFGQCGAKCG